MKKEIGQLIKQSLIPVGASVIVSLIMIGGVYVMECAYTRWLLTEGFWHAVLSQIQFGFGSLLFLGLAHLFALLAAGFLQEKPKWLKIVYSVCATLVAILTIYLTSSSWQFGRIVWWEGFFSTLYSLTAFMTALYASILAIVGIVASWYLTLSK